MLSVPAPPYRRRRGRPALKAPPAALILLEASYAEATEIVLTFDRPIDVGAIDVAAIAVGDGPVSAESWRGNGPARLVAPAAVQIALFPVGSSAGAATVLDAGPGTGIVAAGDGGAWAGVTNLLLPFP